MTDTPSTASTTSPARSHGHETPWYQEAIVYQLHVKVFRDSNGDGIGDLPGLIEKLDYLQDLGVTAIWLLPFYPSPLRDDGYDTADYLDVHPSYGTLDDVRTLLAEARARGLRVITELVLNHTSDQHPWFQRARNAPAGSPERSWYVWSDTVHRYADARIIFQDFEQSNWTWDPVAQQYYWHRFYHHQPDLNWESEDVRRELFATVDHWFDLGVDGLRLDAVPYLFEQDGTNCENLPETHQLLKDLRAHVDARHDDKMLLAEANMWPDEVVDYFGDDDECHMAFHFPLMPRMFMAVQMEDRFPIIDILQQTPDIPTRSQWAIFLRNHDELTLEMVTDEERDYMWRIYAEDQQARSNLGIRRRLAPLLGNNRRLVELMNALLFSLPGTPIIYYGDEIGMGDNIFLGDRDGVRTPMQWSDARNAGFSEASPQQLCLPVVSDPEYHAGAVNVESQQSNPESLLWWMKRLITLRRRHPALSHGMLEWVPSDNRKVLTYLRSIDGDGGEQVLCVTNLSRHVQYVELDLSRFADRRPLSLFGQVEFPTIGNQPYMLTLGPHDTYWFSLEQVVPAETVDAHIPPTIELRGDWRSIVEHGGRRQLEDVLGRWLVEQPWFRPGPRRVRWLSIVDSIAIGEPSGPVGHLLLVRTEYADGDPQTWIVPVAARRHERRGNGQPSLRADRSVIARVRAGEDEVDLVDGMDDPALCTQLLLIACQSTTLRGARGQLVGDVHKRASVIETTGMLVRPVGTQHANTSVAFDTRLVLKLLRQLHDAPSPDVEVGEFLTDRDAHDVVPDLVASVGYGTSATTRGRMPTIALVQEHVDNEGTALSLTLDALERFLDRIDARPDEAEVPEADVYELASCAVPTAAQEAIGAYLGHARMLGEQTARLHAALSSGEPGDPFAAEPATPMYRRSLYQSLRGNVRRAVADMRAMGEVGTAAAVLDLEDDILKELRTVLDVGRGDVRIRCHGDFHLEQVLWTGRDFVIIDVEGESDRAVSERRIRRSALRDVAGMLRSFSDAAWMAGAAHCDITGSDAAAHRRSRWLQLWQRWVGATFLRAYLDAADTHVASGGSAFLPVSSRDRATLLRALLLDRTVDAIVDDARRRPDLAWAATRSLQELMGVA